MALVWPNANLVGATLYLAQLHEATLFGANLQKADLQQTELDRADLYRADLSGAELSNTIISGATLAYATLYEAEYYPMSAGPAPFLVGLKGLHAVSYPAGREDGLVQLRDLLQKAGLRNLEREATFAIERGRTRQALDGWWHNPGAAVEAMFRRVAFEWTTGYGFYPGHALAAIVILWAALVPIYAWVIAATGAGGAAGIYRIWPKDRVTMDDDSLTIESSVKLEWLHARGSRLVGWAAYFSLLSAFQIGFREFSVGAWLSRAQPRVFALEASGWVRSISGIQSLLSVYLLAMWVLTYFGRPFQ
jgi:hypothetical protein